MTPGSAPTLADVAAHLGVSRTTVSNAYNRPNQLSPALREKVLAAAGELGYTGPDPMARGLRRGQTGTLGLVFDQPLTYAFTDPAASLFLRGLATGLEEHAQALTLIPRMPEGPSAPPSSSAPRSSTATSCSAPRATTRASPRCARGACRSCSSSTTTTPRRRSSRSTTRTAPPPRRATSSRSGTATSRSSRGTRRDCARARRPRRARACTCSPAASGGGAPGSSRVGSTGRGSS